MSIVNTETGEILERPTEAAVRESVRRVIEHAESIWDEWAWQVENQTWLVLGYTSWDEMRNGEYASLTSITAPRAERPELVSRFRKAGLTQIETAETLGLSRRTVQQHDEPTYQKRSSALSPQTPAPMKEGEAGFGAGQDSSDVVAVGAPASEETSPAAAFEPEPAKSPAPRPQVSPLEAIVRDHEQNSTSAWRKRFAAEMARSGDLFRNVPADVAENAGAELLELLEQHIVWANDWHSRVKKAQPNRLTVINGGSR